MMFYNFDYRAMIDSENVQSVEVVSLKGYSSQDSALNAKPPAENVARVPLNGPEDVRSLGEPVLRALYDFKAKKPAGPTDPVDADLTWEMLQPTPRKKKEGELTPPAETTNPSSEAGAPAGRTKEKKMAKAKKVAKKAAKAKKSTGPRGEKTLAVKALLQRPKGCTREDILKATGWPAVSVPAMAKACGLKLKKDKQPGKNTVYFGS